MALAALRLGHSPRKGMFPGRALPEGHLRLNKCIAISETGH